MKKSEMARAFAQELRILRECMEQERNKDGKWNFAYYISGAAFLAEQLGIIDSDQKDHICEEARAAAMGEREDPLDEIC